MKKALVLMLAMLMLVSVFAGCTGGNTETAATPATNNTGSGGSTAAAPAANGDEAGNDAALPLSDTLAEISIWGPWGTPAMPVYMESYNDCIGYAEMEKITNVHVNWTTPAMGTENETFQLMMASQEYPDVVENFSNYYSKGLQDAVENEIIVKTDDLIAAYMPNYSAIIVDPDIKRDITTDAGYMAAICCLTNNPELPWTGNCVRLDWLNKLGLGIPLTYDQLHDTLVAFRDQLGVEHPMQLDGVNVGGDNLFYTMSAGFYTRGDFYQVDGKVVYGPTTPEYGEYLKLMRQWYAEGLIDPDFTTHGVWSGMEAQVYNDELGYGTFVPILALSKEEARNNAIDPDFEVVAVPNPMKNEGDPRHFGLTTPRVEGFSCITTACENPELICRWYDYMFSEEGFLLLNYGIEGYTYTYDEYGDPCLIADTMEEIYGCPVSTCTQFCGPITFAHYRDLYRGRPLRNSDRGMSMPYIEAGEIWAQDKADYVIPGYSSMTSEEGTEYNAIYSDLDTYVDEISVKIILGALDLSAIETMQKQISSMGVDRAIELRQAALDRYYAR